jgi:hypothetical protein
VYFIALSLYYSGSIIPLSLIISLEWKIVFRLSGTDFRVQVRVYHPYQKYQKFSGTTETHIRMMIHVRVLLMSSWEGGHITTFLIGQK